MKSILFIATLLLSLTTLANENSYDIIKKCQPQLDQYIQASLGNLGTLEDTDYSPNSEVKTDETKTAILAWVEMTYQGTRLTVRNELVVDNATCEVTKP